MDLLYIIIYSYNFVSFFVQQHGVAGFIVHRGLCYRLLYILVNFAVIVI